MKINVKLDNFDEELMFKRFSLNIGGKQVVTPITASHKLNPVSSINEIYKSFDSNKLDNCMKDEGYERKINAEMKRGMTSGLNVCFVDYNDLIIPNDKQIEALSDIQYEHSDIVTTPIMSKIIGSNGPKDEKLLETFTNITNKYIEIVETLNHKGILGVIPSKMPRGFLEQIIKNYKAKNVTSFIIDFDGRAVDTNPSWIRNLFRLLKDNDLLEESFLYSVNANKGKFMKQAKEILAKDFISIGFGMDILGLNHIPPRMSSETWAKIKQQRTENTFRVFNRDSYGYLKKTETELKNAEINNRDAIKNFNITEQFNESKVLQQKLKEEDSIEPYLKTKSQVNDEVIRKIKKIRKSVFKGD
ncbi:MAG: hypothetical protein BWK75_06655 [Candidatus Altiarchaeales archaeon A3]|nr:MAG: hypothetical protein BWK75_06655 [Candidatus Altiarchaeales archaeon A3]